jgi:hypothetical protein
MELDGSGPRPPPNQGVALDRAGITVFRGITFLAAGPASERSRYASQTVEKGQMMPSALNADENRDASLRAQSAAFRDFRLSEPPTESRALELWMQHAAGFVLFEKVRAAGLATLEESASDAVRAAVELAVDATMYALMMQIDGVSGGLRGANRDLALKFGVELTTNKTTVAEVDLRNGDGMCMGFHMWCDGDFGEASIVDV